MQAGVQIEKKQAYWLDSHNSDCYRHYVHTIIRGIHTTNTPLCDAQYYSDMHSSIRSYGCYYPFRITPLRLLRFSRCPHQYSL